MYVICCLVVHDNIVEKFNMMVDVDQPMNINKDPLHVSNGPITRFNIKALKEALNRLVLQVSAKKEIRDPLEH